MYSLAHGAPCCKEDGAASGETIGRVKLDRESQPRDDESGIQVVLVTPRSVTLNMHMDGAISLGPHLRGAVQALKSVRLNGEYVIYISRTVA